MRAAEAVRWTEELAPVWFGRRIIGSVYGARDGSVYGTTRDSMEFAGFPNGYADVVAAIRNGQFSYGLFKIGISQSSDRYWTDFWPLQASSLAHAYSGTALTARQFTDASDGAIYHGGNVSPALKHVVGYTNTCVATNTPGPVIWLTDRVLSYDKNTIASTTQTMTNTLTAQRWVGTGLPGLRACFTCATIVTGATASNFTGISYTNEASVSGRAVPLTNRQIDVKTSCADPTVAGTPNDSLYTSVSLAEALGPFFPLAPGDIGVSSIQSYIMSAANTGTTCFALVRPLVQMVAAAPGVGIDIDGVMDRLILRRVYDGACLGLLHFDRTQTSATIAGTVEFAWN